MHQSVIEKMLEFEHEPETGGMPVPLYPIFVLKLLHPLSLNSLAPTVLKKSDWPAHLCTFFFGTVVLGASSSLSPASLGGCGSLLFVLVLVPAVFLFSGCQHWMIRFDLHGLCAVSCQGPALKDGLLESPGAAAVACQGPALQECLL